MYNFAFFPFPLALLPLSDEGLTDPEGMEGLVNVCGKPEPRISTRVHLTTGPTTCPSSNNNCKYHQFPYFPDAFIANNSIDTNTSHHDIRVLPLVAFHQNINIRCRQKQSRSQASKHRHPHIVAFPALFNGIFHLKMSHC